MGRLFGTDGARGIANKELTCELSMNIGRAAAYVLTENKSGKPKVLIGKDSRISSNMIEMALAAGLCSVGADVVLIGFVPTPAIAYLVKELNADAGVMISASHNPCEYNGIKIFDGNGFKLPDALEEEIEALVLDDMSLVQFPIAGDIGTVFWGYENIDLYIDHIAASVGTSLKGLKIALDCANGSASYTAEKLFTKLGADFHILHTNPDGVNINAKCGSTHMEDLVEYVKNNDVDLGLAFDGDADRCLALDENGELIDGDKMIAICALDLKAKGFLKDNTAVVTVMSNLGFKHFARANGVNVVETKVGDRYVLEEMVKNDFEIGGEQSGHIIFKRYANTGDGQLSGAILASILLKSGKKASELASVMTVLPQTLVNIKASKKMKRNLDTDTDIKDVIDEVVSTLGERGRILVRASGTEPLIRVMLEGEDIDEIRMLAEKVADAIEASV